MEHPSAIQSRLFETVLASMTENENRGAMYMHSVLTQTCLPYRNPGASIQNWDRKNGRVWLMMQSGRYLDPISKAPLDAGLPYGPKARLVLAHIGTEALLSGKPEIETEDTLTRFVHKALRLHDNGRNVKTVKDQLIRLAACRITLGMIEEGRSINLPVNFVDAFDVWSRREGDAHVRWPKVIRLSAQYFDSLQKHSVPLNESHLTALSHSAMALDIYTWLAQRLHRVKQGEPALIPWGSLHAQFGEGYENIRKFRQKFLIAFNQVLIVYRTAHVEVDRQQGRGLTLFCSPTPVPPAISVGPWKSL
jgi:hypothetical protein